MPTRARKKSENRRKKYLAKKQEKLDQQLADIIKREEVEYNIYSDSNFTEVGSMNIPGGVKHHEQVPPLVIDLTDDGPGNNDSSPSNIPARTVPPAAHSEENLFICSVCGKSITTYHKFTQHQYYHIGNGMYRCTWCEKRFSNRSNLQKHLRVHTGEKPYKCTVCGRGFSQSSSLSTHWKIHSEQRPSSASNAPLQQRTL